MCRFLFLLFFVLLTFSCNDTGTIIEDGDLLETEKDEVDDFVPDGDSTEVENDSIEADISEENTDGDFTESEMMEAVEDSTEEEIDDNSCSSDLDCKTDNICSAGECVSMCFAGSYICPADTKCDEDINSETYGHCIEDNSSSDDCTPCDQDSDCEEGEYCNPAFFGDPSCVGEQNCCVERCKADTDCDFGLICRSDGRCGKEFTNCGGEECPKGYVCDTLFDTCVLNCPKCAPYECCDANSAPNCYTCTCENPAVCGLLLPPCCYGFCCSTVIYGVEGFCI